MPSRFTAQSGKGAILVALALVATLLVPSMYTWAVKGAKPAIDPAGDADKKDQDLAALNYFKRMAAPDRERPLGLSALEDFTPNIPPVSKRKGLIVTQIGFFNPKDAKGFDKLPADLRPVATIPAPAGKGMGLGGGTGIIQITDSAVKSMGYDKIEARVKELGGVIAETRQERSIVVRGDNKAMAALVKEPWVEAAIPYAPAFKLEPTAGKQMLLDKVRASKMELDVHIQAWSAKEVPGLLQDLKSTHSDTVALLEDGLTIRATLDKNELKRVLKLDAVKQVAEIPEYQLSSNFVLIQDPPVVQVGEAEHTFSATPYWDAGVDGGGCGYCSNAFGTACTTDAGCAAPGTCVHASAAQCTSSVPATIVAILDNGASTDAATLAHSTTALSEAAIAGLIAGGSHRKIAAYQVVNDAGALGTTCDNVLSGGLTHGNVVAGIIAGNASALGYTFQRSSNAGSFGDIRRFNLDGSARGARLTIQDAGGTSTCAVADLTERGLVSVATGTLTARMDAAYATGARLHVMPFGIPTWTNNGTTAAGQYNADAGDLDRYLENNLEYMVFVPVGNKGFSLTNNRDIADDFFDGESSAASDPTSVALGVSRPLQISPPATAKNGVSAGATCSDTFTMFGPFNEEENVTGYTAKGPATSTSLRTAPILVGVGNDRTPTGGGPAPLGMYTVKSKDNDQGGTVDTEVSEQARGTSFGAASIAAAATLMEDYFHQGFYPSGTRTQGDRVSVVSGAAVKAMLAASANFTEQLIGLDGNVVSMDGNDVQVATTRGSVVALPAGGSTVLVNNQQGYGRPILSQVLPLGNWANVGIPPDGAITQDTIEKPALGLLVWEHGIDTNGAAAGLGNSLPVFSGTAATTQLHNFTVLGNGGQIRACISWPDPIGDLLVNDLDLELVSPNHCTSGDQSRACASVADCGGVGSCVASTYDGNVYNPSNQITGQWGLDRAGGTDRGDTRNPIECVHLSEDPDGNPATTNSQIVPGTWLLRVKYGTGGSIPGSISDINGADEDVNGNNRLDAGEDTDGDNRLDKGGQPYAAVVSGPVVALKGDATTPAWFANYPTSIVRLDQIRYTCRDDASILILDGDATQSLIGGAVTVRVFDPTGAQVDSESNIAFTGSNSTFNSGALPVRQATTGTSDNGILEGDTGYSIEVTYADPTAGSRTVTARAPMNCDPNFLGGVFVNPGGRNAADLVFGGCDNDQSFDKNELVTYSVSVVNNDIFDQFTDVTASLTACNVPFVNGSCSTPTPASTLAVLDSPKNIGRLPVGQPDAVTFSVQVGTGPFAVGQKVYLRLGLSATGSSKDLSRLSFEFVHPMGTDKASLHYSTDYPAGSGTITRDLNRSLVIEPNDRPGLTLGNLDETIQFSSLFTLDPSTNRINNRICTGAGTPDAGCTAADETYPALGILTPGAVGDGVLDRHLLVNAAPSAGDLIPWNFDNNNGGWYTARDANSAPGVTPATLPLWHWMKNGVCGFQTQSKSNCVLGDGTPGNDPDGPGPNPCAALTAGAFSGGVWHTGSGQAGACSVSGAACYLDSDCPAAQTCNGKCVGGDVPGTTCASSAVCTGGGTCVFAADYLDCGNYGVAFNAATPRRGEFLHDYLVSPIIEKVNQGTDAAGYPFTVEFQRFGFNNSVQFRYGDDTLYINIDNDADTNNPNAIVRPGVFRGDGFTYYVASITQPIDPVVSQTSYNQTTFGPTTDPDGSLTHCSVTTATACASDAACPAGEVCGKLTGDESGFAGFDRQSTNPNAAKPRIPVAPSNLRPFPGPTEVHPVGSEDTVAGPSRNFDLDIVNYEDGIQFFTPGDAGRRFQIGMSFLEVEQAVGSADGDFGIAVDDVVFEWDETHPVAETTASCDKIGIGAGEIAAGCRCPTLSVDRTNLYDCNETVTITVDDSRYSSTATGACDLPTDNEGAPDTVHVFVWSNSDPFPGVTVALTETGNNTGIFTGQVPVSGIFKTADAVFTVPGTETNLFFAYEGTDNGAPSSQCDSNQNHIAGQSDFDNLDGDGITAASGRDGICGTADDQPAFFGADGLCGFNPSTGAIDDTGDNCALVYNPAQVDADGDKVGGNDTVSGVYAGCDNCPLTYNPSQADGDLDGVGDACDWDDVDNDGVPNGVDNCPDVPNTDQAANAGSLPRGLACNGSGDTDGDGVIDKNDNCVNTPNAGQADSDIPSPGFWPALGDACDGDCQSTCSAGSTLRAPGTRCTFNSDCGGPGTCNATPRVCSSTDDDADLDGASDVQDNCAVTSNPTPLPGSDPPVQTDDNFNGIGNACDPVGSFDENADGLPDDVANGPFFALAVTCKNIPLANIVLLSNSVRDRAELKTCTGGPTIQACNTGSPRVGRACTVNADCGTGGVCGAAAANSCGDGDGFGDPGERIRMTLFLQNISGFNLTGISLSVATADPDIECILDSTIQIASFPNNTTLNTASLSPGDDPANPSDGRYFEMVISPNTTTVNPAAAARANLTMTLNSNEAGGTITPVAITALLDLDIPPGATPVYTAARCDSDLSTPATAGQLCSTDATCGGAVGSCKPGLIYEGFETPGAGGSGTAGIPQPNDFSSSIGFIEHSVTTGESDTTVHGVACYQNWGFVDGVDAFCRIDPDSDTDWHFETASAPQPKSHLGTKSAHWGRHTIAGDRAGDTTPLRMVEAFDTNPINLTISPAATDLFLSYWDIVSFADDNRINFQVGQSGDYADVQIAVDQDPNPGVDSWSRWQKLVPFQNVYEHTPQVWSWFAYCHFTPGDAAAASNPAVYGETMCFPEGVWSHSGNVLGTNTLAIFNAQGPGVLGSTGQGVWVQSKFNLGLFIGQRVKIRWIAQSWAGFGDNWESYMEPPAGGAPFDIASADDGWWIDDIQITGAITTPVNPIVDPTTIPLSTQCPASAAANCDQTQGNSGFNIIFTIDDTDQDGTIAPGEEILLDASQTTNPGGCADGVPQFQFSKLNGATTTVLQSWSTATSLKLSNEAPGDVFRVEVRCSSDTSCQTAPATQTGGAAIPNCPGIPFLPFANVANGNAPQAPGFTNWLFGASCAAAGAGASNICAQTHSFLHGNNPNAFGQVGFSMVPQQWGNVYITTGPQPVAAAGATCAAGDNGMCATTPWGPIPAAGAICGGIGGLGGPFPTPATNLLQAPYIWSPNSCDVSPGGRLLPANVCPNGAAPSDLACGDTTVPAVGQVIYYLAGYHAVGAPGGGCGVIAPALPATSAVFVPAFAGADCYRIDDDASVGGPCPGLGCFAPVINGGVGCQ